MIMKSRLAPFTFFLPLFLFACSSAPELPTEDEANAAIMEKIEMQNDRWSNGDPMGFLDNAAQDITWMDDLMAPKPIVGYEALKAYLESFKGQIPPHEKRLFNFLFQYYEDVVIVTYHYQGTFEGDTLPPWKVTSVFRYAENDWLSVHENWTEVEQE